MHAAFTPLLCRKCGHKWDEQMLQNVIIKVWLCHVKTVRCPECRANWKDLSFVLREPDEKRTE